MQTMKQEFTCAYHHQDRRRCPLDHAGFRLDAFTNKASVMYVHEVRFCCRSAVDGHASAMPDRHGDTFRATHNRLRQARGLPPISPPKTINSMVGFVARSHPNIRKVWSDQMISPLATFHAKLPVPVNLCASVKYISLRSSAASIRF